MNVDVDVKKEDEFTEEAREELMEQMAEMFYANDKVKLYNSTGACVIWKENGPVHFKLVEKKSLAKAGI